MFDIVFIEILLRSVSGLVAMELVLGYEHEWNGRIDEPGAEL